MTARTLLPEDQSAVDALDVAANLLDSVAAGHKPSITNLRRASENCRLARLQLQGRLTCKRT